MDTWSLLHLGVVWSGSLFLLWLTGRLIARALSLQPPGDLLTHLAVEIGLGLSFWPVLLLLTDTLGLRWTPTSARFFASFIGLASLIDLIWVPRRRWRLRYEALRRHAKWLGLFGVIILLTLLTRWLHIHDLVLPPWIDSVHHTMVTRLLIERGALPNTYTPFIPEGRFFYHWGYHALVAWLAWLLKRTDPLAIAQLVLQFGQVLNTLIVLMLYAAGRVLFNSRRAGLLAALITGVVSWFPAYYVTWGRYTQLAGLLVFCSFLIMLWQIRTRFDYATMMVAALLGAGVFLIHIRVFIFALTFIGALTLFVVVDRDWRTLGLWLLVGLTITVITAPWLRVLIAYQQERSAILVSNSPAQIESFNTYYNVVQKDLLWAPHNRELLSLATAGVTGILGWGKAPVGERALSLLWLGGLVYLLLQKRKGRLGRLAKAWGLLALWGMLTVLLLNIHVLGMPNINIIHNNSAIIALFIPLSLAVGGLFAWVQRELCPVRWAWIAMLILVLGGGLWGALAMKDVVNPTTVLARPADVEAMRWIKEHTSPAAHFAVNIWPWLGQTYAGSDGGYWIPLLTDRSSILPPALYTACLPKEDVSRVNQTLTTWSHVNDMTDQMLRRWLQRHHITHVYVGANGGIVSPQRFNDLSFAQTVYRKGGVWIYKIERP